MSAQPTLRIYERRHYREVLAMVAAISSGLVVIAGALALL